jgi:hypothetical protein
LGENNDRCKINKKCGFWNNGLGASECYQCRELNKQASNHDQAEPFYLDETLIENARENGKLVSVIEALRNFKPHHRIIVEDNLFLGVSPSELAREHSLSRQQVHRIIWQGRHDIKLHLGLSTVF